MNTRDIILLAEYLLHRERDTSPFASYAEAVKVATLLEQNAQPLTSPAPDDHGWTKADLVAVANSLPRSEAPPSANAKPDVGALTLTIDQLTLAVFTEEYRTQRESFSGDLDAAIRKSFKAALRAAEIAPEFSFGEPTPTTEHAESDLDRARAEYVRDQARREHAERIAETPEHDGVGKLAAFFAENGYAVAQQRTTPKHSVLTLACGAIVNVWSTGTANVQGKPSNEDRRSLVELLRADGWKVSG